MSDKQLYTLCGVMCLIGAIATNSLILYVMTIVSFISSIVEDKTKP
jgi:hypothetical protein